MDIEKIIESFALNFKKYVYAILGILIGIFLIKYGILKTIFILILGLLGYNLENKDLYKKIKEQILKKIKS